MKVLVLTMNHVWCDSRIYFRIIQSLLKKDIEVFLLTSCHVEERNISCHVEERNISCHVEERNISEIPRCARNDKVCHVEERNISEIPRCARNDNGCGPNDNEMTQNDKIGKYTYACISQTKIKLSLINAFITKGLKYKPDIVLCIEPITMIAGIALKKALKCRVVYDAHEYYAEAFAERNKGLYKQYLFVEKKLAARMDAIIAVNDNLLERFKPNSFLCANYPKMDCFVPRNDSGMDCFVPRNDGGRDKSIGSGTDKCVPYGGGGVEKKYDAIYAGGLWFERGLKIYLETANLFKINQKSFKMLIIGSFKNKSIELYFQNYLKVHELEEYVIYKPYMPQTEVLKEMRSAKVGLFFGDIQNSPRYDKSISMKVLEYFSQKIPVIINKLDVLGDFVDNSKGGWIIEYDSLSLYTLLNDILDNGQLLNEKANNGYDYVYQNAVWENQEDELYKAIFGG